MIDYEGFWYGFLALFVALPALFGAILGLVWGWRRGWRSGGLVVSALIGGATVALCVFIGAVVLFGA